MELPKVASEMARLTELFVGTWHGDETLFPSEWDPKGGPATGTWTVRPGADGFCLLVEYDEARDGVVQYRGHGVHGFDVFELGFYAYWFDNIGSMPKAGARATLDGNRYSYVEQTPMGASRFTYEFTGDEFTLAIDRAPDGTTWAPMHAGRYRRT